MQIKVVNLISSQFTGLFSTHAAIATYSCILLHNFSLDVNFALSSLQGTSYIQLRCTYVAIQQRASQLAALSLSFQLGVGAKSLSFTLELHCHGAISNCLHWYCKTLSRNAELNKRMNKQTKQTDNCRYSYVIHQSA